MRVRGLMSTDLFTVRADETVLAGHELMRWARIRHVPVVDEAGALVGLITLRDLIRTSVSSLGARRDGLDHGLDRIEVRAVMTTEVRTVEPDTPVQLAAREMRHHKIDCLPVVEDGRLVGIVTAFDLLGLVESLP